MDDTHTTSAVTEADDAQTPAGEEVRNGPPGFSERGRMRRRMRFLRKARELAYRDLGGLVFDLHRFGRRNDALVLAKLETIGRIDGELRALEATLAERRPVTVLREAGVAACPRCAAIHGSDDRFCPNCGLAMDLRAERPMAGPQSTVQAPAPSPPTAPAFMPAPSAGMTSTAAHTPAPAPAATGQTTPPAPAGATPTTAAPTPGQTATPAGPATASSAPAAPAPSPAPATTASPAPATPRPPDPAPTEPPAPAGAPPEPEPAAPAPAPAPARGSTRPSGPAPAVGGDRAAAENRPNVDQPTEIVRPHTQNP